MRHRVLALVCGIALAAAALPVASEAETKPAAGTPASGGTSEAAAPGDTDEIICREEAPTGSRIRRTVCRKRSQIEENAEDGRRLLNRPKLGDKAQ